MPSVEQTPEQPAVQIVYRVALLRAVRGGRQDQHVMGHGPVL
ncbi:hypothetical protein AB0H60_02870 [Nocardia rhamnosiphila]